MTDDFFQVILKFDQYNEAPWKWFAHLPIGEGGGGVSAEFDAEFKFAKIQNSHLWGGGGGSQNLMLSSNLLKSKIPICEGGGGVFRGIWCWVQIC